MGVGSVCLGITNILAGGSGTICTAQARLTTNIIEIDPYMRKRVLLNKGCPNLHIMHKKTL